MSSTGSPFAGCHQRSPAFRGGVTFSSPFAVSDRVKPERYVVARETPSGTWSVPTSRCPWSTAMPPTPYTVYWGSGTCTPTAGIPSAPSVMRWTAQSSGLEPPVT